MSPHVDRRSFLLGGAALAGGLALGAQIAGEGGAGAVRTNGPGRNGVGIGRPRRRQPEHRGQRRRAGLRPGQRALRHHRIYVRPHGVRPADGGDGHRGGGALPGPVRRPQRRLQRFRDGHGPLGGHLPRRHAARRGGAVAEPHLGLQLAPHRHCPQAHHRRLPPKRPAVDTDHDPAPLRHLPLHPGRVPGRLHRRAVDARRTQRRHGQPHRHRPLQVPRVGAQQPLHRHGQLALLAAEPALLELGHLQAGPRRRRPGRSTPERRGRHDPPRRGPADARVPGQPAMVLCGRRRRTVGSPTSEPPHVEPVQAALQQRQPAGGGGQGHQPGPDLPGPGIWGRCPLHRALPARLPLLPEDDLPRLRPGRGRRMVRQIARRTGARASPSTPWPRPPPSATPCSSSRRCRTSGSP